MISKDQKNKSLIVCLVPALLVKYSFGCGSLVFLALRSVHCSVLLMQTNNRTCRKGAEDAEFLIS